MKTLRFAALTVTMTLLVVAGCAGAPSALGEDEPLPADLEVGKGDSFFKPTQHGELAARDGDAFAEITATERFHAWTFTLTGDAEVTLNTRMGTAFGPQLDTVLYLYRVGRAGYLARNDEAGAGWKYSQIVRQLGAGQYRVVVKGRLASMRGKISISSACAGRGCYPSDWLTAMKDYIEAEGFDGEFFHELSSQDTPPAIHDAVQALDALRGDDGNYSAMASSYDLGDGRHAYLVQMWTENDLFVEIYDAAGALAASGYASESSNISWD